MDKLNVKLILNQNQSKLSLPPQTNTLKNKFRLRKKSSSSDNSCIIENTNLNSSNNSSQFSEDSNRALNIKQELMNFDADPVFNGLVNDGDLIFNNNGVTINLANTNRDVENAWCFVKQLTNALRYLEDTVHKNTLEQLSGVASILLDIVVSGYAKLRAHLIINEKSDLFILSKKKMCASLAELIKWSDVILLHDENALDKKNVCLVVNSVKEAVESLVKLCVEKHKKKMKLHSNLNLSNEITLTDLNSQIEKLNLKNSNFFNNLYTRNKVELVNDVPLDDNEINVTDKKYLPDLINEVEINDLNEDFNQNSDQQAGNNFSTQSSNTNQLNRAVPGLKNLNFNTCSQSILNASSFKPSSDSNELINCDKQFNNSTSHRPTSEFKNNLNYYNVAHIVETKNCCNQLVIENLPPPLPPKKKTFSITYSNQLEHPKQILTKNAFIKSNCIVNDNQCKTNKSNENMKFNNLFVTKNHTLNKFNRSSSLSSSNSSYQSQTQQRKHHSDNGEFILKEFFQFNSNLNDVNNTVLNSTASSINSSINSSTTVSSSSEQHLLNNITLVDGTQVKLRNNRKRHQLLNNFDNNNTQIEHYSEKRPSSQYDNLSLSEYSTENLTTSSFSTLNTFSSGQSSSNHLSCNFQPQTHSCCNFSLSPLIQTKESINNLESNQNSISNSKLLNSKQYDKPPPLPPKKKNISAYMQLFGQYIAPNENTLAQTYRYSMHTVHEIKRTQSTYKQIEKTFDQQIAFNNLNQFKTNQNFYLNSITTSSDDSILSIDSLNPDLGKEMPPDLPPKKKANFIKLPDKPEAYKYKNQLSSKDFLNSNESNIPYNTKIIQQFNYQPSQANNKELIRTAKLKYQSSSFPSYSNHEQNSNPSLLNAKQFESRQCISKENDLETEQQNLDEIQTVCILDELDIEKYLIYKKENSIQSRQDVVTKEIKKDIHLQEDLNKEELQGGPVDALIVKATEVSSKRKNDFLFLEAFLTTYRTFVSPTELIKKLIIRFNRFINLIETKQTPARNAFALLIRVVDDLCSTDCNNELMQLLLDFIYALVVRGDLVLGKVLRTKVIQKFQIKNVNIIQPLTCLSVSIKQVCLLDFKAEQLAEQMTLFDNELFVKIEPAELLLWAREQKEEPNLNRFTEHFNKMSYWARSRIIEENDCKEREKIVYRFIKVMKYLRKFNNFNSYLALLSALDSAPIRRLDWPKSITETLNDYSNLIDSSSSFRVYRQILEETEPPSIPYIGLILQDLTFVHIGNSDFLPDTQSVNFVKRWQIFNILDQLRKFRYSQYNFKKNEQIINYFDNFDNYLSEEAIWQISQQLKPKIKNPKKS